MERQNREKTSDKAGKFDWKFWIVSLPALLIGLYTFFDSNVWQDVVITPGRKAKFHAGILEGNPPFRPVVFLNLCFTNKAGKLTIIRDSRLLIKCKVRDSVFYEGVFESEGEFLNIISAQGNVDYQLVPPTSLLGHSSTNRQIAYIGKPDIYNRHIPDGFDVDLTVEVLIDEGWESAGSYSCRVFDSVWTDLADSAKLKFHIAHPSENIVFKQCFTTLNPITSSFVHEIIATFVLAYLLAWFGLLILAVVNGAVRDFAYGPHMSELAAHQISCFSGLLLFAVFTWFLTGWFPIASQPQAIAIGAIWFAMTVAFEFLFFHYVGQKPWAELLADFNVFKGRLWVLVLVWVAIAPWVFYRLRR